MKREEIIAELKMTYNELISYLIKKYGGAVCDYYCTPECKSKNKKISRAGEGLYCHHMDEDKCGNLGEPRVAQHETYEWQKKERLVYCNILEHLILHTKICILRQTTVLETSDDYILFFSSVGIFLICSEINDMFMNDGTKVAWKKRCFEEVKDNYGDYISLLKAFIYYVDTNYAGSKSKSALLVPGTIVHLADGDYEIIRLSEKGDKVYLRSQSGKEYSLNPYGLGLSYSDIYDLSLREMSSGYSEFYLRIYEDIKNKGNRSIVEEWGDFFKVDSQGRKSAQ